MRLKPDNPAGAVPAPPTMRYQTLDPAFQEDRHPATERRLQATMNFNKILLQWVRQFSAVP